MRKCNMILLILAMVFVFVSNVSVAQTTDNLPVYPGGKVAIELSFTNKDFLPAVKECINLWPTFMSAAFAAPVVETNSDKDAPNMDAMFSQFNDSFVTEFQAAIAGLNQVSVVAYMVPEKTKGEQITDYYMMKLGLSKGWMRSVTANDPRGAGSIRVYTKPDLESIIAIGIQGPRVFVVKTQGKVDLAAITRLSGKMVPIFMTAFTTQQGPEQPVEDIIENPMEGPIEDPIEAPIEEIPSPAN